MLPVPYRVAALENETHDTWTLTLEPAGEGVERFAPGQFSMLYAFGVGEAPISLSGGGEAGGALVHTVRAVGAVTETLCRLAPGGYVGVRGPFGTAWPVDDARGLDVVVVAGGIGLAPLRPVVDHVLTHRDAYRRLAIAYGGRSPAELLYLRELEDWRDRPGVEVAVTVDAAAEGWADRVGVVTTLIPEAVREPVRTMAFVCGPEAMMRFSAAALVDAGLAPAAVMLSMERSMRCAVGHCGHCQLREYFVCRDGPVFPSDVIEPLMRVREL